MLFTGQFDRIVILYIVSVILIYEELPCVSVALLACQGFEVEISQNYLKHRLKHMTPSSQNVFDSYVLQFFSIAKILKSIG